SLLSSPPSLASAPDDDVTVTDAPGAAVVEPPPPPPTGTRNLPVAILLRVRDDDATVLLPRGHQLPAAVESRVTVDEGSETVTASLFEGDGERLSRHLWTGVVTTTAGERSTCLHLEVDLDGELRLFSPGDEGLRVQLRVGESSQREGAELPEARSWWRRLLGG
ncbi:MAG: hypothetical protein ACO3JL_14005, partial [Myxococcota bacterium]